MSRHRPSQSSISSLAFPLSPLLTFRLQSSFLAAGVKDAFQFAKAASLVQSNPHIRASLTKCTLLQLGILTCVAIVDYLVLPQWTRGANAPGTGIGRNTVSKESAKFYFQLLWLYPLVGISFLLSGSFFSNVAARAHSDLPGKGRASSQFVNRTPFLSRSLIVGVYLLLSALLSRLPYIGSTLSFLYLSLISSYYCFEYRFISHSLVSLRARVEFLESRWVYFLGFGLSPTLLSTSIFSSPILNLAIWSLVFPFFLLIAAYSDPLPYDPSRPAKSHDLPGHEASPDYGSSKRGTTTFANVHLNPEARLPDWWPVKIYILSGAVILDDLISGFLGAFKNGANKGAKKQAEYPSNYGGQGGSAFYDSQVAGNTYAARRNEYAFRPPPPSATSPTAAQGGSNQNAHLQSGFGNVSSAPGYQQHQQGGGFARQADSYFGNRANGSAKVPGTSPNKQDNSNSYGIGKSAGVSLRQEALRDEGGMQSRRRGGPSQ